MNFADAYKLPIGDHVEKKGKFSYLSWCYAVRFLRENFPDALWIIHENSDGLPIFTIGMSHMVKVSVILEGKTYTQWHPILNGANKPIPEPSSFDINTSIHRALTKAIGIATGIGLGLYAGEDLPKEEEEQKKTQVMSTVAMEIIDQAIATIDSYEGGIDGFEEWYKTNPDLVAIKQKLDQDGLKQVFCYYKQCRQMRSERRKAA